MTDLTEIKNGLLAEIVERVGDPVATMDNIRTGLEALWHDADASGDQQKAELVNAIYEHAQQMATTNNMLIDVTAAAREALQLTKDEYESILNALHQDYTKNKLVLEFAEQVEADTAESIYTWNFVSEEPGIDMCEDGRLDINENDAQVFFDLLFSRNGHYTNDEEKAELEIFITEFVGKYTDRTEAEKRARKNQWEGGNEHTN